MTRIKLCLAFVLVFVPVAVLSAPAPRDKMQLAPAGKFKIDKLVVNNAALLDENRVVIVGRRGDAAENISQPPATNNGVPNGAIIDLAKKSAERFTNGHKTQIWGVSSHGGRIITTSSKLLDVFLRSWDLKTHESKEVVKLDEARVSCEVRYFHKSDRLVAEAIERLLVFDPAKPQERTELTCPGVDLLAPIAVSPEDGWIACIGDPGQIVIFRAATKKPKVVTITSKDAEKWFMPGLVFSPSGKLFVCRHHVNDEVPKGKAEKDVPAERRGIVRIDLPEGKVVPLGMGHTGSTLGCAVDGRETWLATVGRSRPDKQPDGEDMGELRVYNLASGKLAYREQLPEKRPVWVSFTPSGKRLVCVSEQGVVRWWDVPVR